MVSVRRVLMSVMLFLAVMASVLFVTIPRVSSETSYNPSLRSETAKETAVAKTKSAQQSTSQPAPQTNTTPIRQATAYTASPSSPAQPELQPNSITFAGVYSPIVEVGLTATNAVDVPASQVGRWNGSAVPGEVGAVFLDGHTPGIFSNLNQLVVGSVVTLVYNQQTFIYKVVATETVSLSAVDMRKALSVQGDATHGLTMMTCAGSYVATQQTYDKRLVVYAVQV